VILLEVELDDGTVLQEQALAGQDWAGKTFVSEKPAAVA
jgi:hypothetical protein